MRQFIILIAAVLTTVAPAPAQNVPSDSQTLRDILGELRRLRQELRTTTVAAERVQIALYRLQLQDLAVAKASKMAEDAHSNLAATAAERKRVGGLVEQWQHALENESKTANERKELQELLSSSKSRLEQLTKDEAEWQLKAADADALLAREQARLEDLHSVLDELDQALRSIGRGTENRSMH